VTTWHPLLTKTAGLKLRLRCVKTREAAQREFEEFVVSGPGQDELELASGYYARRLFELDEGWR
jgi:hypothetical protein